MGVENESATDVADTAEQDSVQWDSLSASVPGQDDSEAYVPPSDSTDEEGDDDSSGAEGDEDADEGAEQAPANPDTSAEDSTEESAPEGGESAPIEPPVELQPKQELTPEQIAAQQAEYTKWLGEQQVALEGVYALDEATAEQLQTEPELVLPKLMATMHLNLQRTLLTGMQQMLPQMVQQVQGTTEVEQKAHSTFYGAFPELKGHHEKVLQVGAMYRQLNPEATPQEALEAIGQMTAKALKIQLKGSTKGKQQQKSPAPHRPVRPGSGAAKPASTSSGGEWDSLLD